jgi:hypothetical protein
MKQLDQSPRLTEYIKKLSAWLARRRGAPNLLAMLLPDARLLLACGFTLLHVGIIIGLIGILLIEPLGQG